MDFKHATDQITRAGVTLVAVAEAFGVTPNTVSRWRSGQGRNALNPPADWHSTLADLARRSARRADQNRITLASLAEALDG